MNDQLYKFLYILHSKINIWPKRHLGYRNILNLLYDSVKMSWICYMTLWNIKDRSFVVEFVFILHMLTFVFR